MKTTLSLCIALLTITSANAQVFRSQAVRGALLGGIAGGVIGHNSGDLRHNGWRGAAIGAVAGGLIGQAVGDARAHRDGRYYGGTHDGHVYRSTPSVHVGVGYSNFGHHGRFGHFNHGGYRHHSRHLHHGLNWRLSYAPSFGYHRGYGWGYPHISYRDYSDYVYRSASVPMVVQQPPPVVVQAPAQTVQPAQAAPQQVTIINNYYNSSSPMSAANGLFGR